MQDPGLQRLAMSVLLPPRRANLDCLADQVGAKDYDVVLILGYRSLGLGGLGRRPHPAHPAPRPAGVAPGPLRVVTELLDSADIELAMESGGDDYVVSDALSGYLMAQLAENPELGQVFDALVRGDRGRPPPGAGRRATALGSTHVRRLVTAAQGHGEVALGYLRPSDDGGDAEPGEVGAGRARPTPTGWW